MDGGLAAPTEDGDDSPARGSPGRGPAPAPASPGGKEPNGRSGAGPRGADSASGIGSRSQELWQHLVQAAMALWRRTAPLRRKAKERWRRVLDALQETAPVSGATWAPSAPAGPLIERLEAPAPIRVSGQGRTFNFHVHARCVWSSEDLRREALVSYAHYYMTDVVRRLTPLAAQHAANFAAHRAAELEVALERALSEASPWRYQRGDLVFTCEPHVVVDVDERVRKVVLPYWEELVKLDCEFDVDVRRAEYADRLGRPRATTPQNSTDDAAAAEAAPMTSENVASEVRRIVAELKAAAQRLEDSLGETPRDGDTS